jgi:hypothetical protein
MAADIIQSDLTFRQAQTVHSLVLMNGALPPMGGPVLLTYAENSTAAATTVNLTALPIGQVVNLTLRAGSWYGVTSTSPAAAHLYFVCGDTVRVEVQQPPSRTSSGDWFRMMAPMEGRVVAAGDQFNLMMFASSAAVNMAVSAPDELAAVRSYLVSPTGLRVLRGKRVDPQYGMLHVRPQARGGITEHAVELSVPRPPAGVLPTAAAAGTILALTVPLQCNWTAGLFQIEGYSLGFYHKELYGGNPGHGRYSALGLDDTGAAHVPLFVGRANLTHVVVGHPVLALSPTATGEEIDDGGCVTSLHIQVTRVNESPATWHVAVNNPTAHPIDAILVTNANMALPGLNLRSRRLSLEPGAYMVLT